MLAVHRHDARGPRRAGRRAGAPEPLRRGAAAARAARPRDRARAPRARLVAALPVRSERARRPGPPSTASAAGNWDLYELAEELVDLEDWFRQWRFRHVTTVERIIGHKTRHRRQLAASAISSARSRRPTSPSSGRCAPSSDPPATKRRPAPGRGRNAPADPPSSRCGGRGQRPAPSLRVRRSRPTAPPTAWPAPWPPATLAEEDRGGGTVSASWEAC